MSNRLPNKALVALLAAVPAIACSADPGVQSAQATVAQSGEHTGEVLAEIGYDEAAVARLHDAGVV